MSRDTVASIKRRLLDAESDEGRGVLAAILDELLAAYAHELAEQIRASEYLRDWTDDHMGDCYATANFIDPEVTT